MSTCVLGLLLAAVLQVQTPAAIELVVTSSEGPVPRAQVIVGGKTMETDAGGHLTLNVPPGPVDIIVVKTGFNPVTVTLTVVAGTPQVVPVMLERQTALEERVIVSATRTDKRIEDQPMRVEVLDAEEIEEKQLMTPGDIVMMLNEMGGLRVQATRRRLAPRACVCRACAGDTRGFCPTGCRCLALTSAASVSCRSRPPTWARSR